MSFSRLYRLRAVVIVWRAPLKLTLNPCCSIWSRLRRHFVKFSCSFSLYLIFIDQLKIIFSAKPTLPDNYQENTWDKLQEAVVAIQTSKSIAYSLEELYQAVENMCSHKMDSQIYSKLTALTEMHVKSNIKLFFADSMDKLVCDQSEFVTGVSNRWWNKFRFSLSSGVSEEDGWLLVSSLSTNAHDSQYFLVPRSYVRATKSDCSFDMVRIFVYCFLHFYLVWVESINSAVGDGVVHGTGTDPLANNFSPQWCVQLRWNLE